MKVEIGPPGCSLTLFDFECDLVVPGAGSLIPLPLEGKIRDLPRTLLQALGKYDASLLPFRPIFDIIEVCVQVLICIEGIPKAITELDPTEIINCVPDLIEKVNKLLQYLPQLSIPYTLLGIVCAILAILEAIILEIYHIVEYLKEIIDLLNTGIQIGDVNLQAVCSCGELRMNLEGEALLGILGSLQALFALFNFFSGMIGGPGIPTGASFSWPEGAEALQGLVDQLAVLAGTLQTVRDAIPL